MKKIIAAALSILLGAFGYTIVDKAMEDRVATLESEVVELRGEVSSYHQSYSLEETTSSYETTQSTTESQNYTTTSTSTTEEHSGLCVGDYLWESSDSHHKFLLRKWSYGNIEYISPQHYNPHPTTTYVMRAPHLDIPDDPRVDTSTTTATYTDFFLYITEASAQWTDTEETISYTYSYDRDYSQISQKYITEQHYITFRYKGYTDPQLAGTKINFRTTTNHPLNQISISNNIIDENGNFEFEAVCYGINYCPYYFSVNSIKII